MAIPLLDLKAQHAAIREEVVAALMGVVESQAFILGEPVSALEKAVADLSATRYAVGCANGTDALLLALRAVDIKPGDEVITTPFTFFATAGAIHNAGARPVFVDIEDGSLNIDAAAIAAAVGPRTRAVIAVDLFGQMAAMERIVPAAGGHPVIEDAAQSIGASRIINGKRVMAGEAASIGTFSFFPSKNLGGFGDGGMLVTQDDHLFDQLMKLRTHGGLRTYYHELVGYNSRLDALQAAVLLAKLPHLEAWSEARRRNAAYYDAAFADLAEVTTPFTDPANTPIFNQYTIRVPRRDALKAHLAEQHIGCSVYYPLPLHLQPCFSYLGYKEGQFPVAEKAAGEVISLPIYPELSTGQLDEVIAAVRTFFGR